MKILPLNEGHSDNLGDQAIKDSLLYLLNNQNQIDFHDFTRNTNKPIEIQLGSIHINNDRSILLRIIQSIFSRIKQLFPPAIKWAIKHLKRLIKVSSNKYDLVVIGGGQLILSKSLFPIAMFMWVFFLRLFKNKNIILFGVGSDTKFSLVDKLFYRYVFKRVNYIYLRDFKSQEILQTIFHVQSKFVHDVAFIHNKVLKLQTLKKDYTLLGIANRAVYNRYNSKRLTQEQYFESWLELISENSIDLKNIKLFYTTAEDRVTTLKFQSYIYKKYQINLELLETNTKDTLIRELANAKCIASGRMHALILGLTYGCEIITYKISDKLKSFDDMYSNQFHLERIQSEIFHSVSTWNENKLSN